MIFDSMNPMTGDTNIGILNRRTGESTLFRDTDDYDWFGRVSSEGNFLAYSSNELGTYEVFVENLDRGGGRWKLSVDGGFQPVWNPAGHELFYLSRDGSMMAVDVESDGGALRNGAPRTLFHTNVPVSSVIQPDSLNHYDVSADGKTFLISTRVEAPSPIMLILNWTALVAE